MGLPNEIREVRMPLMFIQWGKFGGNWGQPLINIASKKNIERDRKTGNQSL